MDQTSTPYGKLLIGDLSELFTQTVCAIEEASQQSNSPIIGLTGGSTPKAFYLWAAQSQPFSKATLERTIWSTSDERHVPLESDDSNFGHAQRGMFNQLGIPEGKQRPWPVKLDPEEAASQFNEIWNEEGREYPFSVCLLGMGDDCHTASLFPHSPLLERDPECFFSSVEVPGKGSRLTVTPYGLKLCPQILITVTGSAKAEALKSVLESDPKPETKPVQLLASCADAATWLVDREAAEQLDL